MPEENVRSGKCIKSPRSASSTISLKRFSRSGLEMPSNNPRRKIFSYAVLSSSKPTFGSNRGTIFPEEKRLPLSPSRMPARTGPNADGSPPLPASGSGSPEPADVDGS